MAAGRLTLLFHYSRPLSLSEDMFSWATSTCHTLSVFPRWMLSAKTEAFGLIICWVKSCQSCPVYQSGVCFPISCLLFTCMNACVYVCLGTPAQVSSGEASNMDRCLSTLHLSFPLLWFPYVGCLSYRCRMWDDSRCRSWSLALLQLVLFREAYTSTLLSH